MSEFLLDWKRLRHDRLRDAIAQILWNNGFHAVLLYRLARWLLRLRVPGFPEIIRALSLCLTGAEICAQARIGSGLVIKHPCGIVIGDGVTIGTNCTLLQNVTIGERIDGTSDHSYPTIGNNVLICAGAVLVGGITIGSDVVIGANAVVLTDIPSGTTAVGVPAKVIKSERVCNE